MNRKSLVFLILLSMGSLSVPMTALAQTGPLIKVAKTVAQEAAERAWRIFRYSLRHGEICKHGVSIPLYQLKCIVKTLPSGKVVKIYDVPG